jgi:hypothetical protein
MICDFINSVTQEQKKLTQLNLNLPNQTKPKKPNLTLPKLSTDMG